MNAPEPIADEILTQAGEWLLELQSSDVSVERIAQWQQWLASSEQHARAFDQLQQTWRIADQLSDCDRDTLPWPANLQPASSPARRRRGGWFAAAASLVLAVGFGLWLAGGQAGLVYETAVGEQRSVRLADGSVLAIGPSSRVRVSLESELRQIDLDQGEAYFQVAKDPHRRFTVRAGSTLVTAIGTAFNVRRNQDRVVVGVSEGTVSIAPSEQSLLSRISLSPPPAPPIASTRLTVGEQLVVEPDPVVAAKVERIEPPAVASWREGRLHYSGEPLSSIIADINRYVAEPIVLSDPSIAGLRVTGSVSEANIERWLTSLEASLPVEVVKNGDGGLEVRARP